MEKQKKQCYNFIRREQNMKLKELRQKHNLTQKDIAKLLKMPYTTYNSYESGKSQPSTETLQTLADYYNVSLDEVFGREYSNIIDKSKLNETQLQLIKYIINLDENNQKKLEGCAMALWSNQQNEQITIQNLKQQYPNATFEIIDKKENK